MKAATVSSRDLFNPKLNPGRRMDAHFGIWLAGVLSAKQNAEKLVAGMEQFFKNRSSFLEWRKRVRSCETIEAVEDAIADAILKYDVHGYSKKSYRDVLDPRVLAGVTAMAKILCAQQSLEIRAEIQESVEAAERLSAMAKKTD